MKYWLSFLVLLVVIALVLCSFGIVLFSWYHLMIPLLLALLGLVYWLAKMRSPSGDEKTKVFVSYHSKDYISAKHCKRLLENHGIDVVMYSPLQKWIHTYGGISKSLASSSAVVYVGRERFMNLEEALRTITSKYVRLELDAANRLGMVVDFYCEGGAIDPIIASIKNSNRVERDATQVIVDSVNSNNPEDLDDVYGDDELSATNLAEKMTGGSKLRSACFLPTLSLIFVLLFLMMLIIYFTQLLCGLLF